VVGQPRIANHSDSSSNGVGNATVLP